MREPNAHVPADMFMLDDHLTAGFVHLQLSEGDNPPIYSWDENYYGESEAIRK